MDMSEKEKKLVAGQDEWDKVAGELSGETDKLMSYDKTLLEQLGSVDGRLILDYGCGPGVLASELKRRGANIKAYDISDEMRKLCGGLIGHDNVYSEVEQLPWDFDIIICNLAYCIVDDAEVSNINHDILAKLGADGKAYVGFCNPLLIDVPETALDIRYSSVEWYLDNHGYEKEKKEGDYRLVEMHRPIGWYERAFFEDGLKIEDISFTPEYELKGRKIKDFIIFRLSGME
jgi:SAM-dependent methyltransferase